MSVLAVAAVGIGAMLGAWTRWGLGALLNPIFPLIPLGTLSANLFGGLCMGIMMIALLDHTALRPELVLMITTGFLGSLTTFSAFSAETMLHFSRQEYIWFTLTICCHVFGTLIMTGLGMWTSKMFLS